MRSCAFQVCTERKPQWQENAVCSPTFIFESPGTKLLKIQTGGNNCSFRGARFLQLVENRHQAYHMEHTM